MEKKTKSKEAGYVPFTRDDINLEDGRNVRAEELFLQMLDVPKKVIKKKNKGKTETITDDDFYPTSKSELQKMQALMEQVEEAIDDPSDTEFMENVAYMKDVLVWSKKRHWSFAWWIVICVAVISIYYFVQSDKRAENYNEIENWSTETMQEKYDYMLDQLKKGIEYHEKEVAAATTSEEIKDRTKALESQKKLVKEREEMGIEGYRDYLVGFKDHDTGSSIWSGVWCLIWLVLYIIAERPYGYMLSKRRTEMKVYSGLRGVLFGVAGAIFGAGLAMKPTETVTTWSNGTKTRESDAGAVVPLKIMIMLAAVVLVLVVARIVIVIATIMGFIRNYDLIGIFTKKKELTAKQEA